MRNSKRNKIFVQKVMEENKEMFVPSKNSLTLKDEVLRNVIETHRTIYEKKKLPVWQYKIFTKFILELIDHFEDEIIYILPKDEYCGHKKQVDDL